MMWQALMRHGIIMIGFSQEFPDFVPGSAFAGELTSLLGPRAAAAASLSLS